MIEQLCIENLGVISHAELDFSPNFTVLSGETGAGKSMVLNSIALLMGKKADPDWVRHGSEECMVTGIFAVEENTQVFKVIEEAGAKIGDGELYLARQVRSSDSARNAGRSRAFAGGRPVPAAVLSQAAEFLVAVHGQNDQLLLRSASAQLELLDKFGGSKHQQTVADFRQNLAKVNDLRSQLAQWEDSAALREIELQHLQAGLEKIAELEPQTGEEEELVREIEKLSNVEDLRLAVNSAYQALEGSDDYGMAEEGADLLLSGAERNLETASGMDENLGELLEMLSQARTLVRETSAELSSYLSDLSADPQRLERNQQRLSDLRHGYRNWATGVDEWLAWSEGASQRVAELSGPDNLGDQLRAQLETAEEVLQVAGQRLTKNRQQLAEELSKKTAQELAKLGMAKAGFVINIKPLPAPNSYGYDQVIFGLSAGGKEPRPLGQGASGGELSRIMLALEVVLAATTEAKDPMTFIFDEVDSGIGGETAQAIGKRLAQLARHSQVIVVTHLPQVAAWADQHLVVSKNEKTQQIQATVSLVSGKERVTEIARMLSGQADSESARQHAEELLEQSKLG